MKRRVVHGPPTSLLSHCARNFENDFLDVRLSTQLHDNHTLSYTTPTNRTSTMGDAEITASRYVQDHSPPSDHEGQKSNNLTRWRAVEVGRVVLFSKPSVYAGKIAVIVEIIDHKRVCFGIASYSETADSLDV